jgi:Tfp pilus assembly protein PilF
MSLLLQALQKAAKNRETGAPETEPSVPEPPAGPRPQEPAAFSLEESVPVQASTQVEEPALALAEEDLFEPEELPPAGAPPTDHFEPFEPEAAAPTSAKAAMFVRAGETQTTGWLDWVRDHPVHIFAGVSGVFLLFYGVYVYLQIFNPGILRGEFFSQDLVAKAPPPPAHPIAPPTATTKPAPTTVAAAGSVTPAPAPVSPKPAPVGSEAAPTAAVAPAASTVAAPTVTPTPPAVPQIGGMPKPPEPAPPIAPSTRAAPKRDGPPMRRAAQPAPIPVAANPMDNQIASSRSAETEGNTPPAQILMAYQALQNGKLDQAEALYREAAQRDPDNVDAQLGLAAIATQRGSYQQAVGFYERALELEPKNTTAQAGLIDIIGHADPATSEAHLKQLIARDPSAFLYYRLGSFYARQEQWPSAQAAYFQAYQMQPDNADYAYNLAIGLEHLSQAKPALNYYRKALELSFQKGRASFDQQRVIERIGQLSARVD